MYIYSAKIKIKKDTPLEDVNKQVRDKRFNLTCDEVVDIFKDIITMKFGRDELQFFKFDKSTQQHLRINDLKTGDSFTASCHFKGKFNQYNPGEINLLLQMMTKSIRFREEEAKKDLIASSGKWIKVSKWANTDGEIDSELLKAVEAKNHGGLDDWFKKEKWVDVSRPKKKGKGYEPCGRGDTSKGKKPVCTPANKAKNLTEKERKNRVRQKRQKEKEPNPDKKPNNTTYSPGAGGKSNVSNTARFKIVTSDKKHIMKWIEVNENPEFKGMHYLDMENPQSNYALSPEEIIKNQEVLREVQKDPKFDPNIKVDTLIDDMNYKIKISDNHNIRFFGSMIPLSDLRPAQPKFVKVALLGEEDEFPSTDISAMFSEKDDMISNMSKEIQEQSFKKLVEILTDQMGLSGPDTLSISSIKNYQNPVQEEMTEQEYITFIRHKNAVIRSMYKRASEGSDSKLYEILHKMILKGVNPFNYSDTVEVVREVLEK
jgi:hypothetical protein